MNGNGDEDDVSLRGIVLLLCRLIHTYTVGHFCGFLSTRYAKTSKTNSNGDFQSAAEFVEYHEASVGLSIYLFIYLAN